MHNSSTNWAGNHEYPMEPILPTTTDELRAIVSAPGTATVRFIGSRHSFTEIADGEVIVDLAGMPEHFEVDADRRTVTVSGWMTFGRLAELLEPHDLALHNLASLPHISIAGAIATGTHGSGHINGGLCAAVVAIESMGGDGTVQWFDDGGDVAARVVGLGACGCVTKLKLRVEPAYEVEQRVFDRLSWTAITDSFDDIFGAAYSVSGFTRWGGGGDEETHIWQVWLKHRSDQPDRSQLLLDLGAEPATDARHPIKGIDPAACTEQFGVPGRWSDRLPHFRMDFSPSAGDEIQSEFFVARANAADAITALRGVGSQLNDALLVSEIRTVAADAAWMSPTHGRDSVAFHFTWKPDQRAAERAAAIVSDALAPFGPRPHWGKVFPLEGSWEPLAKAREFLAVCDHRFTTPWVRRTVDALAPAQIDPASIPVVSLASGATMPTIGMGTFGSDHVGAEQVAAAVRTGIDLGYRHIDCASVYGNEAEIGEVFREVMDAGLKRSELWISSKVWNDSHDRVVESCEQTLRNLQIEYLDNYLVHWPFPNHHPPHCDVDERNPEAVPYSHEQFMETWLQMESLVERGLTRHIGTSNMTRQKLEPVLAEATIKPSVNQMELHPHFQQPELFEFLVDAGIQPIGFCPLGSPARPDRDRTDDDSNPLDDPVILAIAQRRGVHPAIVCLKWAIQRGQVPIPFSTTPRNLLANLASATSDPLSDREMTEIEAVDRDCRLIKGQVFLWPAASDWTDLWL